MVPGDTLTNLLQLCNEMCVHAFLMKYLSGLKASVRVMYTQLSVDDFDTSHAAQ